MQSKRKSRAEQRQAARRRRERARMPESRCKQQKPNDVNGQVMLPGHLTSHCLGVSLLASVTGHVASASALRIAGYLVGDSDQPVFLHSACPPARLTLLIAQHTMSGPKQRLQALSQQLSEGIPDAGSFEDIPRIRQVAGDSVGP
jgi:hypothetical protein